MKSGDDDVAFILNPDLGTWSESDFDSAGTATGELTTTNADLNHALIYFATAGVTTLLDEIRIGTEFSEVFVPEPATLFVLSLGLVPVLLRRRKG